jgi:hypothetical protein
MLALASKGGKNLGINNRKRKQLKEELELLLEIAKKGKTNQQLACIALLNRAKKGDVRAFEVIRDTTGQKAKESVEHTITEPIKFEIIRKK